MNKERLKVIIDEYKHQFKTIHDKEINKWRSIKQFQHFWNPDATNFTDMLEKSLHFSKNLLDSGSYFPKRMLSKYAQVEEQTVKNIFFELFNEENDLIRRINFFKKEIELIHNTHFKEIQNHFQDHRAIIFYLCMMYPERYYLYKFEMLKKICELLNYPYNPKRGKYDNIIQYFNLCSLINFELKKDDELIKLHHDRLQKIYYQDTDLHVLTQDIIYASVKHLKFDFSNIKDTKSNIELIISDLIPETSVNRLQGVFINFEENEREQKRLGDIGELMVLQYEKEKLSNLKSGKRATHDAKMKGDGIGYDIYSFDKNDKPIFIEVKATRGNMRSSFFITQNELIKSQIEKEQYFLYRLFDLDEKKMTAKMFIINGDLSNYCNSPLKYRVVLKD